MEIFVATLLVAIVPPIAYILYLLVCNHYSNQFFQKNLPDLPVLGGRKPILGHLLMIMNLKNWKYHEEGHKKLGKNYGLYYGNQRVISTIDLDLVKRFAVDEDHHDRVFPLSFGLKEFEIGNLFTAQGEQWRRIRRAMAPALSRHKVMSQNVQSEINSVIDKFVDSIEWRLEKAKREKGEDFIVEDVDEYLQKYALALVFTCIYKKDNVIDFYAEKDYWQQTIDIGVKRSLSKLTLIPQVFPIINPIMRVLVKIFNPMGKLIHTVLDFVREEAELYKRASLESKRDCNLDEARFTLKDGTVFRGNMIDYFIGKFMTKSLSTIEFFNSSFFLFMAANRTSSDALSRLIHLLACNQEIQDKLRDSVSIDGIESTYLTWVINELLRLFPPVHLGCSRTLVHDMETKFGTIPKDTFLMSHIWTIHRWPEYWGDDANEFKPERWAKSDTFHPMQYIPFGAGRKICLGKEFALREMRMLMVKLLPRYKFERTEKTANSPGLSAPFYIITIFDDPTWIKISPLRTLEEN